MHENNVKRECNHQNKQIENFYQGKVGDLVC